MRFIDKFARPVATAGEVRPTDIAPVIAPNKDGRLDEEDVKALADFGKLKAAFFSKPITNELCNVVVMSEDVVNRGETCDEWLLYENDLRFLHQF